MFLANARLATSFSHMNSDLKDTGMSSFAKASFTACRDAVSMPLPVQTDPTFKSIWTSGRPSSFTARWQHCPAILCKKLPSTKSATFKRSSGNGSVMGVCRLFNTRGV